MMDVTRQILFTEPGKAELREVPLPPLDKHGVLVKTVYSTISSGTERANLSGQRNVSIYDAIVSFPRVCGYSASGLVTEVGSGVRSVKPGERVAVAWGQHSQYTVSHERNIHKIENASFQAAALALIGTFPLGAIRKCHPQMGETAIVMGQGVLGQIAVSLLRACGMTTVIAADPIEEKRQYALGIGADVAMDPYDPGFAEKVREITYGGVNVAIEVTGVADALNSTLDCMAPFGRVALLGCTRESSFAIDYYHKVHATGVALLGAHTKARPEHESFEGLWTEHDDILTVLRLNQGGRLHLEAMVQEVHSPLEAPAVYQRLLTEPGFPVVQFDWTKLEAGEKSNG